MDKPLPRGVFLLEESVSLVGGSLIMSTCMLSAIYVAWLVLGKVPVVNNVPLSSRQEYASVRKGVNKYDHGCVPILPNELRHLLIPVPLYALTHLSTTFLMKVLLIPLFKLWIL